MPKQPCTYILASKHYGTLYIGVTSNPLARMYQHRSNVGGRFTSKYAAHRLVYFEFFEDMPSAIGREKQFKNWHRDWKINLIERDSPRWQDLAVSLGLEPIRSAPPHDGP